MLVYKQVGEKMYYIIEESDINDIKKYKEVVKITVEDFLYLNNPKELIAKIIREADFIESIKLPEKILLELINIVLEDKNNYYLQQVLLQYKFPLFSLISSIADSSKEKYKKLLEIKESKNIAIKCNANNFLKGLELAKKLNRSVIIDGTSIPLSEYKKLLCGYDIDTLSNVEVYYQEGNDSILLKELYSLSLLIDKITSNINKYNLSPLEKIIYIYDIVKSRIYKKPDNNKKEAKNIDKVLNGEYIVCTGYSNLFNALLLSLGIKAMPLVSTIKKHQRSLVYISDPKYQIEGVYAFDPTWDSRKEEDYIDNYNYFALGLDKAKKDTPCDILNLADISFEKFIRICNDDDISNYINEIEIINKIEILFNFIDSSAYQKIIEIMKIYTFASNIEKEKAKELYEKVTLKYKSKEIPSTIFFEALYNTRIIEYYNNIIEEIDIENIQDTVIDRASFQYFYYKESEDQIKRALQMICYESKRYEELEALINRKSNTIKRKTLNIRLLKTLKNKNNN